MKIKRFLTTAFVATISLFGTLSLTGCTSDDGATQVTLSSEEQTIYNCIVGSIRSFKDPSSVSLVSAYEKALIGRYVRVSGTNSFGGTVTTVFNAYGGSLHSVDDPSVIYNYSIDYSISVSNINTKLGAYKSSQGW